MKRKSYNIAENICGDRTLRAVKVVDEFTVYGIRLFISANRRGSYWASEYSTGLRASGYFESAAHAKADTRRNFLKIGREASIKLVAKELKKHGRANKET